MKTVMFKYTLYFLLVVVLFACDDFLDKKPVDQVAAEAYFTDEASAESAVRAIYRSMESPYYYGQSMIIVPEFAAGHVAHVSNLPEYKNFEDNDIRIDNPWVLNIWSGSYSIINAANNVIEKVPQITGVISDVKRQQFVLEAKFIRALVYFNLVRSWGDVPLVTTPTAAESSTANYQVPRTPEDEVYTQIIQDLTDASNLPDTYGSSLEANKGRATGAAAKALLAKVYLYRAEYQQAATLAKEVIDKNYTLTQEYSSIWLTENSSESIFELQFDAQATNPLATVSNPTNSVLFLAQQDAYDMFEEGDLRRNFTVNFQNNRYYIGKYRNFNPATQNVPVIRLSEVYLIYAEAQARATLSPVGEPYFYYKAVRDRAGLETADESTFTDTDAFVAEVQREKRRELMFEGEAWYDYVRTGLALTEMMVNPDVNRYFFPIPQVERELNKQLGQNSAYQQ
jgi:starch-binding outer membrane protein, SusD/RagB family